MTAERSGEIVDKLRRYFADVFGPPSDTTIVVRAPGRVNLIGDHTDYNDGFVLPTPIHLAAYVVARARNDMQVGLFASQFGERMEYDLDGPPAVEPGSWMSYVEGVVEEIRKRGVLDAGFELFIHGDVPLGAGLSSSAALEVAVALALVDLFGLELDPLTTIRLCQRAEHRYAGVECGIMDQFVSRLGRAGTALLLDCRTLEYDLVPFSPSENGLALVIADTGVQRGLAASKYGERRVECARAAAVLREAFPNLANLRDATGEMLTQRRSAMGDVVYARARHVVEENARVLDAADALRDRAFDRFGALMNRSHESLRDLFEVSCAELDTLAYAARGVEGVLGARMTGAGFGGCTVNLVRADAVDALAKTLTDAYRRAHSRSPSIYVPRQSVQAERLA